MILNLEKLKNVEYFHFKTETLQTVLPLVTQDCWFCSVDLRDAYFSVHVHEGVTEVLEIRVVWSSLQIHGLPRWVVQCTMPFYQIAKASDGSSPSIRIPFINLH